MLIRMGIYKLRDGANMVLSFLVNKKFNVEKNCKPLVIRCIKILLFQKSGILGLNFGGFSI